MSGCNSIRRVSEQPLHHIGVYISKECKTSLYSDFPGFVGENVITELAVTIIF